VIPDLERLIRLQQLDSAADEARRNIADHPERTQRLDAALQSARDLLAGVKSRLTAAQDRRRADEKEVAAVQTRLAKYKDQLLEVKTNREYSALLHEIEAAQGEIRTREDRILEIMMESDELSAAIKSGEADFKATEKSVASERAALDAERAGLQSEVDQISADRDALVAQIDRRVLGTFETIAKSRKGIAVAPARGGLCTICHVRLRPQVFNEIRKNNSIIQCDSCQRILYFVDAPDAPAPPPA
jgi:predicted  nucleic acid-binding Zn-ribbon protein